MTLPLVQPASLELGLSQVFTVSTAVVYFRAINERVGDMYTKFPNFSSCDVYMPLLARLEKLNSVYRNTPI